MKTFVFITLFSLVATFCSAAKPLNDTKIEYVSKHPNGEVLRVVRLVGHEWITDGKLLENLLLQPEVANRKIVPFSIAGVTKNGKSTFMDYCLRYMYANYDSVKHKRNETNVADWMGAADEALIGFTDMKGNLGQRSGILVWSDVFLHTTKDGQDLAIILIQAQGFPQKKLKSFNEKLFTFNLLASSIQINSVTNLNSPSQLKYLKVAVDFADYFANQTVHDLKPFQDVLILMRDWKNAELFHYGFEGGEKYIEHVFQSKKTSKNRMFVSVRNSIDKTFDNVTVHLMPHPGLNFVGSNGSWGNMSLDFIESLQEVIPRMLGPENLKVKTIGSDPINSRLFAEVLKFYYPILTLKEDVKVNETFEALIQAQKTVLTEKMITLYREKTLESLRNSHPSLKKTVRAHFGDFKLISPRFELEANETIVNGTINNETAVNETVIDGTTIEKTTEFASEDAAENLMEEMFYLLEKRLLETENKYETEIIQLKKELSAQAQEVEKGRKEIEDKKQEITALNEQIVNIREALKKEVEKKDEEIVKKNAEMQKILEELEQKNKKLFMYSTYDDDEMGSGHGIGESIRIKW